MALLNLFSNMILYLVGWISLCILCESKVIEVNNGGKDGRNCCIEGTCLCGSLFTALLHIENDTVINITSSIPLHETTRVEAEALNNITIIGHDVTVECNNIGNIFCVNCSNVIVRGITWDQCGDPNHPNYTNAFGFESASDVSIIACTFQYSKVCTVVLVQLLSGFLEVRDSRFLFNYVTSLSRCKEMQASLAIVDAKFKEMQNYYFSEYYYNYNNRYNKSVSIVTTQFKNNGIINYSKWHGNIPTSATLLCFLTGQDVVKLLIQDVHVSNSSGLGASLFFLSTIYYSNISIEFTNTAFYNNSNGGSVVRIKQSSVAVVWIDSSYYEYNVHGSMKLVVDARTSSVMLYKLAIIGNKGTFVSDDDLIGRSTIGHGVGMLIWTDCYKSNINMSLCNIQDNSDGKSIVYIEQSFHNEKISISSSRFINNFGSALHVSEYNIELGDYVLFKNNLANRGAAIYLEQYSQITIRENSVIEFIGNAAFQKGGAMYVDLYYGCGFVTTNTSNTSTVFFTNNSAEVAGNSIYFSNPESCNITSNPLIYKFNYSPRTGLTWPPISTSPYKITFNLSTTNCNLSDHDANNTTSNFYIQRRNTLGQSIAINAVVYDYYGNISETVQFYVECIDCNNTFKLSSNRIIVHNVLFHVTFLGVNLNRDITDKTNVTLNLLSVFSNKYHQLRATLSLELSPCQSGYMFDLNLQSCRCYEHHIQCQKDYVQIEYGYWFGIAPSSTKRTVSSCPIHYCTYNRDKTRNGYYKLPEELDDQCSSHRTGVACGECKPGYTLAYDFSECIKEDVCHPGITVLVIALTILYWIIMVALVFGLMQCKVSLGYAYGLIYYYSIVDTLLGSNSLILDGVLQLVIILSSFAKLNPQFLGKFCFVKGLNGIDQLFIHYFHAISTFSLIVVTIKVAKHSRKIALIVSRSIIRVICLLILLSYTSLATTSLQLLRPLYFNDVDGAYVYSSPSIKYFTGRHIPYGIIALLCGLVIVIGLPLLLLLEPFLKRKVNFIKIKPLLDQFQECYKDQYHWFAAYYLICRLVIIGIIYTSNISLCYLQTACIIIVTIHVWMKPYKSDTMNVLDGIILLTIVLVANLNSFTFSKSSTTPVIASILVAFPFLLSCLIFGRKFFSLLKRCFDHKKTNIKEAKGFDLIENPINGRMEDEEANLLDIEATIKTT